MLLLRKNITFMVIRGIVALAIVGVAFYCIGQGIHFFALPHNEAEAIQLHVLGLNISAGGLGAVIFGTGVALCFVAYRTTPRKLQVQIEKQGSGESQWTSILEKSTVSILAPNSSDLDKKL